MSTTILERVRDHLRDHATAATNPGVTIGDRVVLVELSHPEYGRLAGVAHRPPNDDTPAWPTTVHELTELSTAADRLERAVGIATLNALSTPEVDWQPGDPMASLSTDVTVVATVGLFHPAFHKFGDVTVRVVERDPPETIETPTQVTATTHQPADCTAAFADADICFVTGSTLIYGGLERYLDALSAAEVAPVVLVGATASHWPEPAFEAGIDLVAGARVTDPERLRPPIRSGGCATDLHGRGLEKVYVARPGGRAGLTLG